MADAVAGQSARTRRSLLVFVHIPKTAGTTLRDILNANEPGPRSRALGNVFKGSGGLDKEVIERLRDDRRPDLRGVGLVRGHLPLGVREFLPKGREVRCFSFLREPIDRTLSHYFHIREARGGSEEREESKLQLSPLPAEPTLEDMLRGGYIHDNLQTRMLSGLAEPFDEVTDEMLEQAKHNLREGLVFFGLTERFDESLVLAKQRLGFGSIFYRSGNDSGGGGGGRPRGRVSVTRPWGDEVPEGLLRAAERCNRYDAELYHYARELFDGAPELGQLEFEIELAALRAARSDGELELEGPPPEGFGGGEEEWRMLVSARAASQRLEGRLGAGESKIAGARARTRELEERVERLESELEQKVERLQTARARSRELQDEVERLQSAPRPRPKRDPKRGPKAARSGPRRDAKRAGTKRAGTKRARSRPARDAKRGGRRRTP